MAPALPPTRALRPIRSTALRGVFVGRGAELERLRGAFDNAFASHGNVVMLVGEPGIGKTRTVQELETYARVRGAQVYWIGSPQILQLSGIGPASLLRDRGVPVAADLPGVGENLQDHLQLRTVYKVQNVRTLNEWYHRPAGRIEMASSTPSPVAARSRWRPLEYHIQPLSLDKFGSPLHTFPAFTASVCNLQPRSRGSVRIKTNDAHDAPSIAPNYLDHKDDRRVAVDALRLTRRIMAAPAMQPFAPEEYLPGAAYQTDEELARAAGDIGATIFHPVGTCKMGPDTDPMAVVDARLRVRASMGCAWWTPPSCRP